MGTLTVTYVVAWIAIIAYAAAIAIGNRRLKLRRTFCEAQSAGVPSEQMAVKSAA